MSGILAVKPQNPPWKTRSVSGTGLGKQVWRHRGRWGSQKAVLITGRVPSSVFETNPRPLSTQGQAHGCWHCWVEVFCSCMRNRKGSPHPRKKSSRHGRPLICSPREAYWGQEGGQFDKKVGSKRVQVKRFRTVLAHRTQHTLVTL